MQHSFSIIFFVVLLIFALADSGCRAKESGGYQGVGYIGKPKTEWHSNGRDMILQEEFAFKDTMGTVWGVPKGAVVDGASIPKVFWSIIGGPFSGNYRDASVIHDYHCAVKVREWREVHQVFYEAMIVSGVNRIEAKIMYAAVYYFGPRWKYLRWASAECRLKGMVCFGGMKLVDTSPQYSADAFDELKQYIEKNDPSLDEILKFDNPELEKIRDLDERSFKEYYEIIPDPEFVEWCNKRLFGGGLFEDRFTPKFGDSLFKDSFTPNFGGGLYNEHRFLTVPDEECFRELRGY